MVRRRGEEEGQGEAKRGGGTILCMTGIKNRINMSIPRIFLDKSEGRKRGMRTLK